MVQIVVDTKKDSPDDIRRVIDFLQSFLNSSLSSTSSNSSHSPDPLPGSFSIFDSAPKKDPDDKPPRVEIVDF